MSRRGAFVIFGVGILCVVAVALLVSHVYHGQSGSASQGSGAKPAAPAGWIKLQGGGTEIWLPPGYVGGDVLTDADSTYSRINDLAPAYSSWVESLPQLMSTYRGTFPNLRWVLIAVDGSGSSPVTLNINRETMPDASMTISQIYDLETQGEQVLGSGSDFKVLNHRDDEIAGLPSVRQVATVTGPSGFTASDLQYVVKDGAFVWTLTFSTFPSTFDSQLPDFDRSAHTFVPGPH